MFSHRLADTEQYVELLAGPGRDRGLMGPREVPRLWDRHLLNCAALTRLLPEAASVCDIGSGAGLPGLVLALRRPDLRVTLVEPLLRRATFLQEAVDTLGLSVEVVRARAEDLHGAREFDVVTSRAVAPLETVVGWSLPLTRVGGTVLAMKGTTAAAELDEAARALDRLGAVAPEVVVLEESWLSFPTTVVRVEAGPWRPLRWSRDGANGSPSSSKSKRKPRTKRP